MRGRIVRLSPLVLVVALAACGGTKTVTVTRTVSPTLITAPVRVYFLRDGKLAPVARTLPISRESLLRGLAAGPTARERAAGVVGGGGGGDAQLAQTVYTLTQFDPRAPVVVNGKRYTRSDFEDETPAILVESPLPFEAVRGPQLVLSGTANTFEATFAWELVGEGGKVLAHHFATATSGSGTRGTFVVTPAFAVDHAQPGKLVVFENSAENGRRIHQVTIPLRLEP